MLLLKIWYLEILLIFWLELGSNFYLNLPLLWWALLERSGHIFSYQPTRWQMETWEKKRGQKLSTGRWTLSWNRKRWKKTWSNKGLEKEVTWLTCNMPRQNSIIGQSGFDCNPFIFVFMIKNLFKFQAFIRFKFGNVYE